MRSWDTASRINEKLGYSWQDGSGFHSADMMLETLKYNLQDGREEEKQLTGYNWQNG